MTADAATAPPTGLDELDLVTLWENQSHFLGATRDLTKLVIVLLNT